MKSRRAVAGAPEPALDRSGPVLDIVNVFPLFLQLFGGERD
jgi:hypothetical protein